MRFNSCVRWLGIYVQQENLESAYMFQLQAKANGSRVLTSFGFWKRILMLIGPPTMAIVSQHLAASIFSMAPTFLVLQGLKES